jgi:hypothetical protein
MDELNMGSLVKTPTTLQKQKGKEKNFKPIVDFNEHVDFHSSKLNGDVNSLIAPYGCAKAKRGQASSRMFGCEWIF